MKLPLARAKGSKEPVARSQAWANCTVERAARAVERAARAVERTARAVERTARAVERLIRSWAAAARCGPPLGSATRYATTVYEPEPLACRANSLAPRPLHPARVSVIIIPLGWGGSCTAAPNHRSPGWQYNCHPNETHPITIDRALCRNH